jgi:hypothetical protein
MRLDPCWPRVDETKRKYSHCNKGNGVLVSNVGSNLIACLIHSGQCMGLGNMVGWIDWRVGKERV